MEFLMTYRLPALKTTNPEKAYGMAVTMTRVATRMTQPGDEVRGRFRPAYAASGDALIASSQVVATHFASVAKANTCWSETL